MRTQDIFGLFGKPRASLGYPSQQLIDERAARICAAAEGRINGDSRQAATDGMYHAMTDPAPGSNTPMSYSDMTIFVSEAIFNKCPDLKEIITTLVKPDLAQAREREEQAKRAALYNPSAAYIAPPDVASQGGGGKPPPPAGGQPPSPPPSTGPMPPAYNPVASVFTPPPAPGSTGGAHDYEEEASEYSQKLREFEEARRKSQEEDDAQIKASNASRDAAEEAMRKKYESGDPNAVCGPGEFWDGRQCRGSVSGNFGNLMNNAMNLGPSGGAQMVTPGNLDFNPATVAATSFMGLGRRSFPVVNL